MHDSPGVDVLALRMRISALRRGPCVVGAREAGIHAVRYENNAQAIAEIEKLLVTL